MEDVIKIIYNSLRSLFGFLCEVIYPGIGSLYDLFINLGTQAHSAGFEVIYNKISLIIGIFMVFRIIFWLIESLINPDTLGDKEKNPSNIVKKVVIVVVLLATTPSIFKYAFDFQGRILRSQIIERVISIDNNVNSESTGRLLAAEMFGGFYTIAQVDGRDIIEENSKCGQWSGVNGLHYNNILEGRKLNINNSCLTETKNIDGQDYYVIDFNGLFAVAIGIFIFWMLVMYCISLGTRYFQLIYLQVVAPIPIMCYLAPGKDNMFSKWTKQCTTTYLDLFIRVAIINFVMLLCGTLLSSDDNIIISSFSGTTNFYLKVFLVLGLLTFAKKAPELVQELLPKSMTKASGDFGLSLKKRSESMLGGKFMYSTLKRAPGYVAGGIAGAAIGASMGVAGGKGFGSRLVSGITGATRGFATGSKKGNMFKNISEAKKNQAAQNAKMQQWRIEAGKGEDEKNTFSDWSSRRADSFRKSMGFETKAKETERHIKTVEGLYSTYKNNNSFVEGKLVQDGTKIYGKHKTDPSKNKFTTMTELKADAERLHGIYNGIDQNREKIMSTVKSSFVVPEGKAKLFKDESLEQVKHLSDSEKSNYLIASYMKMGRSREIAERDAKHDIESAVSEKDKLALNEMIAEKITEQKIDKYLEEKADEVLETERTKAYNEWQEVENMISESGDFADFTYRAQQIAENKGKKEMFLLEFKAFNEIVNSPTFDHLGIPGAREITEEEIKSAYAEFDKGNIAPLEELSNMYHKVMKPVPNKVTEVKMSKDFREDQASDHFNSGK